MSHFVMSYMKQNKKRKQLLESAQDELEIIFNIQVLLAEQEVCMHGRILTEVLSTDRMQRGLDTRSRSRSGSHTDRLSSVNKMFIISRQTKKCICVMKLV